MNADLTGGIDLDLAPQVVTALDDVCMISPRSFDEPSLAALLGEVCLWLVEQRIGPRAHCDKYRLFDPYAQVRDLVAPKCLIKVNGIVHVCHRPCATFVHTVRGCTVCR